jgi:hypothetical protein
VGRRAAKFKESFAESIGDVFPLNIANLHLENDLPDVSEMGYLNICPPYGCDLFSCPSYIGN